LLFQTSSTLITEFSNAQNNQSENFTRMSESEFEVKIETMLPKCEPEDALSKKPDSASTS